MTDINAWLSIYSKSFIFSVDGKEYNISKLIPKEVWDICGEDYTNPMKNWKLRMEIRKIFMDFFRKNIDENIREEDVIF